MREYRAKRKFSSGQAFEAAQQTNDRSYIPHTSIEEMETPSEYTRQEIVRLARYLETNFPLIENILTQIEVHGVGSGISIQAVSPDEQFNINATDYFESWANNKFCTVNQDHTLYQLQALGARLLIRDGEFFLLLTKASTGYRQVQFISTDAVRGTGEPNDESIDGIYIDDNGKPIAYNVWTGDTYQRVSAENVIHVKRTTKGPNQLRGISAFTSALNTARDYKDILKLEKSALKVHSSLAATVTKRSGNAGDGTWGRGTPTANLKSDNQPAKRNTQLERILGANIAYLNTDEKIELTTSNRPSQAFTGFLEELARQVCQSVGLSYEFIVTPEKLNGTGNRVVLGSTNAFFRVIIQNTLIDSMLRRIYGWVIAGGVVDGDLKVSDIGSKMYLATYTLPEQIGIDKGYDTEAAIKLIQNNLLSYESYYSSKGKDYKTEFKQIKAEKELLASLGLTDGEVQKKETDNARTFADTYGVAVRAGALTPNLEDEKAIREKLGLPKPTVEVEQDWTDTPVRKPITLTPDSTNNQPTQQ